MPANLESVVSGLSYEWFDTLGRLLAAVVFGGVIGINRDIRNKPAGMRTHALISLGAAMVIVVIIKSSHNDATAVSRVIQGLLTGIGFIGGGVIMHYTAEHRVAGLTTAATIWMAIVLGIICGMGYGWIALVGMVLVLIILTIGRVVEQLFARNHRQQDDQNANT